MNKVEVLSPAGDMECLRFALDYGADAVYLGGQEFGMRSSSGNFSLEELRQAADMAHERGKKIYLTLNTIPTNDEVSRMPQAMKDAANTGVDAFIIADLGVLAMAKQHTPQMELHFSTQAGIVNYEAALAAYQLGAKRVVLARELSLEDIAQIRQNTPEDLEIEVFVHGAMCMSVSGRCMLSQYLTGRDGNRGQCAQSCRWKYALHEEKRPGQFYEIGEGEGGTYILSADDLYTAPFIDKIIEAGACSLKIEGRAKSFYYVASTTAAYRAAADAALALQPGEEYQCPEFALQEVTRTSHRPYSSGFFLGKGYATQSPYNDNYVREWQLLAVVERTEAGKAFCVQRGKFELGDTLEALLPQGKTVTFTPHCIWDEKGNTIEATPHSKMVFSVPLPEGEEFPHNTILRKKL